MIALFFFAIFLQNGLINAEIKGSTDWTTERYATTTTDTWRTTSDWWYTTTDIWKTTSDWWYTTTERYSTTTDWWYTTTDIWKTTSDWWYTTSKPYTTTTDWWYTTTDIWKTTSDWWYTTTERYSTTTDWWYTTTDRYSTTTDWWYTTSKPYTTTTDWWYTTTDIWKTTSDWWYTTTEPYTTTTDWWYTTSKPYTTTTDWWYTTTDIWKTTSDWWYTTTERYPTSPTPTTSRYTPTTSDSLDTTTSDSWYTTTSKPNHCPVGWIGIPGLDYCYKFVENGPTSLTWLEAKQMCEDLDGNEVQSWLATVDSQSVHYFLSYVAEFESDFHSVEGWFIGLIEMEFEGQWIWSYSGLPVAYGDTFWWPGYPDYSGQNDKDCGIMIKNYDHEFGWVDIPCDEPIFGIPICQRY